jgi:hypothetical protein
VIHDTATDFGKDVMKASHHDLPICLHHCHSIMRDNTEIFVVNGTSEVRIKTFESFSPRRFKFPFLHQSDVREIHLVDIQFQYYRTVRAIGMLLDDGESMCGRAPNGKKLKVLEWDIMMLNLEISIR